ncbi:MAG: hypothetical protein KAJ07_05825 [Planctomycetes bacterium]|nr:hypothetical protein [Planctomycetota bacterium]
MLKEITERFWWIILQGVPLGVVCTLRALGILTSYSFYHDKNNLEILKSLGSFISTFSLVVFVLFCYIVGFIINDISKRVWWQIRARYGDIRFRKKVLEIPGEPELDASGKPNDNMKLSQVRMRELYVVSGILISSVIGISFEVFYKASDYGQNFVLIVLGIIVAITIVFILTKPIFRMLKYRKDND